VIDTLSRPIILLFNCYLWTRIVTTFAAENDQLCPQGAGKWVFQFGAGNEISVASFASKVVFVVSFSGTPFDLFVRSTDCGFYDREAPEFQGKSGLTLVSGAFTNSGMTVRIGTGHLLATSSSRYLASAKY
jgi:hypothetical protein